MNKENKLILIIVGWSLVIILNLWTRTGMLVCKLDKIENNQKEIIEILRNGDVGE